MNIQFLTPNHITELTREEVFVFGSNKEGRHLGGAARLASEKFGAQWGVGVGMTGQCYAIPTMHGGIDEIKPYVDEFIEYAYHHLDKLFLVTRIGCGIAGFTDEQIAPLFKDARFAHNISLPESFVRVLDIDRKFWKKLVIGEWEEEPVCLKERFADKDRVRGCLLGGAVGDALGYPIEFMSYRDIVRRYGDGGLRDYCLDENGVAKISDDTQMTLFTSTGILFWSTRGSTHGISGYPELYVMDHYNNWYGTQIGDRVECPISWLVWDKRLNSRRAPGNTCLRAMEDYRNGKEVYNESKGCGGVMRVAPIAVFNDFVCNDDIFPIIGAKCAELTHKHILSSISSAALVMLINRIVKSEIPANFNDIAGLVREVAYDAQMTRTEYEEGSPTYYDRNPRECEQLYGILNRAISLAVDDSLSDVECIHRLGGGWVAEEALAIAVFCVLRHPNSFEEAVIAAVNHDGDSDSTGSICGSIMGALLGEKAFPEHYLKHLECYDLISDIADDLYVGCRITEFGSCEPISPAEERQWANRYLWGIDARYIKDSQR